MAVNVIVLNRGDSYDFDLTINLGDSTTERYILQGDDVVYFGVMDPGQPFEEALVKKRFTVQDLDAAGNLNISILPEDTIDLFPGKYYYSIKLKMDHLDETLGERISKIYTIINKTKFILCD
jgi:hypothetical protein